MGHPKAKVTRLVQMMAFEMVTVMENARMYKYGMVVEEICVCNKHVSLENRCCC